jgi:UV excision repair protein RAD23
MGPEGLGEGPLNLTPEHQAAIERLCELGLGDRALVVQVYVACDHDEQAAANLLMSMGD